MLTGQYTTLLNHVWCCLIGRNIYEHLVEQIALTRPSGWYQHETSQAESLDRNGKCKWFLEKTAKINHGDKDIENGKTGRGRKTSWDLYERRRLQILNQMDNQYQMVRHSFITVMWSAPNDRCKTLHQCKKRGKTHDTRNETTLMEKHRRGKFYG